MIARDQVTMDFKFMVLHFELSEDETLMFPLLGQGW
jgi:hypothetical protein